MEARGKWVLFGLLSVAPVCVAACAHGAAQAEAALSGPAHPAPAAAPDPLVAGGQARASLREIAAALQRPWRMEGGLLIWVLPALPEPGKEGSGDAIELTAVLIGEQFVSPIWADLSRALDHVPPKPFTGLRIASLELRARRPRKRGPSVRLNFSEEIDVAWPGGGNVGDGIKTFESLDRRKLVLSGGLNIPALRSVVHAELPQIRLAAALADKASLVRQLDAACDRGDAGPCLVLGRVLLDSGSPGDRGRGQECFMRGCKLGDLGSCHAFEQAHGRRSANLEVAGLSLDEDCHVVVTVKNGGTDAVPGYRWADGYPGRITLKLVRDSDQTRFRACPDGGRCDERRWAGFTLGAGEAHAFRFPVCLADFAEQITATVDGGGTVHDADSANDALTLELLCRSPKTDR